MFNEDENSDNFFAKANFNFDKDIEIVKIWDTTTRYHLQIIAKHREKHILIVMVWDFNNNIEKSMF
mgnify:CR=1 FL=1|jgi:hypothetical protein